MSTDTTGTPSVTITPVTSTSLSSSANPSLVGQTVTYTATVSPAPDGGTVAFSDAGSPIASCIAQTVDPTTGNATCKVSYTALGSHSITAAYGGDSTFAPSASGPVAQGVQETPTGLCQLTVSYVESSAKYQGLPSSQQAAINQVLTGVCDQLATITPKLTSHQLSVLIAAYKTAVTVLANGGWLTAGQAGTLTNLAGQLAIT